MTSFEIQLRHQHVWWESHPRPLKDDSPTHASHGVDDTPTSLQNRQYICTYCQLGNEKGVALQNHSCPSDHLHFHFHTSILVMLNWEPKESVYKLYITVISKVHIKLWIINSMAWTQTNLTLLFYIFFMSLRHVMWGLFTIPFTQRLSTDSPQLHFNDFTSSLV